MDDLIDRIYESAFAPETWPDVLADFAKIADASEGWMFVSKSGKVRGWTASSAWARAGMAPFFLSGHVDRSDRMKRLLGGPRSGFFADYDMYTPEELERDPDVLRFRAVGLGWGAGTVISLPTDESFVLVMEKE